MQKPLLTCSRSGGSAGGRSSPGTRRERLLRPSPPVSGWGGRAGRGSEPGCTLVAGVPQIYRSTAATRTFVAFISGGGNLSAMLLLVAGQQAPPSLQISAKGCSHGGQKVLAAGVMSIEAEFNPGTRRSANTQRELLPVGAPQAASSTAPRLDRASRLAAPQPAEAPATQPGSKEKQRQTLNVY